MNEEFEALLSRISSPQSRRAGDAFFSADPLDLSLSYRPDNFDTPDTESPKII
jgi:hypothetical protein